MIDHVNGILYTNQAFAWASYYSVGLFILVSGYNTFSSWERKPYGISKVINKCRAVIVPYVVAVFVYDIISDCYFSLQDYLYMLIHFNASGPHYYVLLYVQLVILGPLLASLIGSNGKLYARIKYTLVLFVALLICIFTTNRSDLLGVYGGGGRLAGGNYLALYIIGMIIAKEKNNLKNLGKKSIGFIVILFISLLYWIYFVYENKLMLDASLPFGTGMNPPSISFGVYAILLFLLIHFISIILSSISGHEWVKQIIRPLAFIGSHTLYIFLYHRLFLDYINTMVCSINIYFAGLYENPWFRRGWIFVIMIGGPILIEIILKYVKKYIISVY